MRIIHYGLLKNHYNLGHHHRLFPRIQSIPVSNALISRGTSVLLIEDLFNAIPSLSMGFWLQAVRTPAQTAGLICLSSCTLYAFCIFSCNQISIVSMGWWSERHIHIDDG